MADPRRLEKGSEEASELSSPGDIHERLSAHGGRELRDTQICQKIIENLPIFRQNMANIDKNLL